MVREGEDVQVIENKTRREMTAATFIQIIFEAERRIGDAPLSTLYEIIQTETGSISDYFAKLKVFPPSAKRCTDSVTVFPNRVTVPVQKNDEATPKNVLVSDITSHIDQKLEKVIKPPLVPSPPVKMPEPVEYIELPKSNTQFLKELCDELENTKAGMIGW